MDYEVKAEASFRKIDHFPWRFAFISRKYILILKQIVLGGFHILRLQPLLGLSVDIPLPQTAQCSYVMEGGIRELMIGKKLI